MGFFFFFEILRRERGTVYVGIGDKKGDENDDDDGEVVVEMKTRSALGHEKN